MDKIKDAELEYATLQDNYVGRAMEWLSKRKKLGVKLPTFEELQDEKMKEIYDFLEKTPFEIDSVADFEFIQSCTKEERNEEALELLRPFVSKEGLQKSELYMDKCVWEHPELSANQKQIEYALYQGQILPAHILVGPTENTMQSVVLAASLAEVLKNQNPLELQNICKAGDVVPLFLENLFASRLSEKEENADLKEAMDLLHFWTFLQNHEYYKALLSMGESSNQIYLKRVNMLQNIYPYMVGYVESLKLERRYKESKKEVLKRIRSVLRGSFTTNQILYKLDTASIPTEVVLEEKVKQFQKGR